MGIKDIWMLICIHIFGIGPYREINFTDTLFAALQREGKNSLTG